MKFVFINKDGSSEEFGFANHVDSNCKINATLEKKSTESMPLLLCCCASEKRKQSSPVQFEVR